jgi:hypothetical protein
MWNSTKMQPYYFVNSPLYVIYIRIDIGRDSKAYGLTNISIRVCVWLDKIIYRKF